MVHRWAIGLAGDPSRNAWFNEGLATHYGRLLAMRAGLLSVDAYLESVNSTARNYYTHPLKNLSLDSIRVLGFSTGVGPRSAQNVPYVRGSLYFADLDASLREGSRGRRTLDDILVPMFARIRAGARIDRASFVQRLVAVLGASARRQFESVIVRGETIVPASDAFGPCFQRQELTFKVAEREVPGYRWVRVPDMPDERCREW
jgi:predicted metalloprotease with PDZ domain